MIVTLAEAKTLLGLGDNSQDIILTAILPMIESDVYLYTKNDFMAKEYAIESISSGVINTLDNDLSPNDTIMIVSGPNGQEPLTVLTATSTEVTVDADLEDETSGNSMIRMKYPRGLKLIVAQMAKYKLSQNPGVKSESIGRYSVTYDSQPNGYPGQIWDSLRKYSKYYKRSE